MIEVHKAIFLEEYLTTGISVSSSKLLAILVYFVYLAQRVAMMADTGLAARYARTTNVFYLIS